MSLAVDGQQLWLPVQWQAARAAGVSVVHQDLGLLDELTVSENIGIGGFVRSRLTGRIDWKAQDDVARGCSTGWSCLSRPATSSVSCPPRTVPAWPSPGPCATPSPVRA